MKSYIFDTACTSFNKGKISLNLQINLLCSEISVSYNICKYFDGLKAVIFMSLINYVLEHRENWKLMICKDYWMKICHRRKKNSQLEVDRATISRWLHEIRKIQKLGKCLMNKLFKNSCLNNMHFVAYQT